MGTYQISHQTSVGECLIVRSGTLNESVMPIVDRQTIDTTSIPKEVAFVFSALIRTLLARS